MIKALLRASSPIRRRPEGIKLHERRRMRERPYLILHGTLATEMNDEKADQRFHGHSSDNAPRGGIRVYEEPEKPDFRF